MPAFHTTVVEEVLVERPGLTRVRVRPRSSEDPGLAYALTDQIGPVALGDEVVVNTTAVDLGLGTGGWHVVHWNLTRGDWQGAGGGHVMKVRYTSVQVDTGVDEEHHPDQSVDLAGTPVVACSLHSQVGVVAATIAHQRPGTRVAYVMTDAGALPLALSDLVHALVERDLLVGTVTTGHAFGGDLEAVSLPSGLARARHGLAAEVIVAGTGFGLVGTSSRLGFSGLDQAVIVDAVDWLGGRAVVCARASERDPRPRHQGISEHTHTVLDAVRSGCEVALPVDLGPVPAPDRHRIATVEVPDVAAVLAAADLTVTTMGRGPAEDPLFFSVAASAGVRAVEMLDG